LNSYINMYLILQEVQEVPEFPDLLWVQEDIDI